MSSVNKVVALVQV